MTSLVRGAPRRVVTCLVLVSLFGMAGGCGGSGGSAAPTSTRISIGVTRWRTATQKLCQQKRAALEDLGSVHITYGGIARLGLPAVKRLLEHYLDRLLVVLRRFAARQRALGTPTSLVSIMTKARAVDNAVQAATVRLRAAVAHVTSPAQLSTVFRAWLTTLQRLSARGETLARQLNLPACEASGAGTAASAT